VIASGSYTDAEGTISFSASQTVDLLDPYQAESGVWIVHPGSTSFWDTYVSEASWDSGATTVSSATLLGGTSTLYGQTTYYGFNAASRASFIYGYSETAGASSSETIRTLTSSSSDSYRSELVVSDSASVVPPTRPPSLYSKTRPRPITAMRWSDRRPYRPDSAMPRRGSRDTSGSSGLLWSAPRFLVHFL
jgi:hypothetical protein